MVFNHTLLPFSTSPTMRKEAVEQRRELVRGTVVIVGVLLAFLVLAALIFGALALIVYSVGILARQQAIRRPNADSYLKLLHLVDGDLVEA